MSHHAPTPRLMANSTSLLAGRPGNGALWKLDPEARDLDANLIHLGPGEQIGEHTGPELDVVLHVCAGSGTLRSGTTQIELNVGDILYLPARSMREFTAGGQGLAYFSVHQRKRTGGLMPGLRPGSAS